MLLVCHRLPREKALSWWELQRSPATCKCFFPVILFSWLPDSDAVNSVHAWLGEAAQGGIEIMWCQNPRIYEGVLFFLQEKKKKSSNTLGFFKTRQMKKQLFILGFFFWYLILYHSRVIFQNGPAMLCSEFLFFSGWSHHWYYLQCLNVTTTRGY